MEDDKNKEEDNKEDIKKPNKFDELTMEFNQEFLDVDEDVKRLATYMKDATTLEKHKAEFYRVRQEIVSKRRTAMSRSNRYNNTIIKIKRDIYGTYKFGQKPTTEGRPISASNPAIKPQNDFERNLFLDADMRNLNSLLKLVDNHISDLSDCLKTVTDMIYGFDLIIRLENWKTS